MFKFNFHVEETDEKDTTNETSEDEKCLTNPACGDFRVDQLDDLDDDDEESRRKFDAYRSDLVPNIYEGGFKTWECSHDLVDYLRSVRETFLNTTTVLEIGCGSGLPGLELNQNSQFHVDFQDFNREVVEQTGKQLKKQRGTYNNHLFFGDWNELVNVIPLKIYDIILTSETIYNVGNYGKLVRLFDHSLKPQGVIYLAAKVYYFGVQGGVRQFEEFLRKSGSFNTRVVRVIDASVKREILEITRSNRVS